MVRNMILWANHNLKRQSNNKTQDRHSLRNPLLRIGNRQHLPLQPGDPLQCDLLVSSSEPWLYHPPANLVLQHFRVRDRLH